jgi:ADP-heptose:LPS heptosyltransferase
MILWIKNIVSLFNFYILKLFYGRKNNSENKNILFFNSEKIGDLTISSVLLEYDDIFPADAEIYFLVKDIYYPLLINYKGKVKIITYKHKKYKWFLCYRIMLLNKLRSLSLAQFYNLTPARGILSDEISVLSGSNKIYSISNNKDYLKFISKITDKYYDEILYCELKNVYEKHKKLMESFGIGERKIEFRNNKAFDIKRNNYLVDNGLVKKGEYIAVSPLSSEMDKTWGLNNYKQICEELSKKYKIVLIGNGKQRELLEKVKNRNDKIIIASTTLEVLPVVINDCRLFIGGNSGPAHIALHLGVKFLVILYGGYYGWYFPFKDEDRKNNYIYNPVNCLGCGIKCVQNKMYCLEGLSSEEVLKKLYQILNNTD